MNNKIIVGSGQLAKCFMKTSLNHVVVFASGVSSSKCVDIEEFQREEDLLFKHLKLIKDKKFIYFSSCALSVNDYELNDYYKHKKNMENLIKKYFDNYYIFRLPQLIGDLTKHTTLISFLYNSIIDEEKFNVFHKGYRYVIEIEDVRKIVESYLVNKQSCITIDIANPCRYRVLKIVNILESLLRKKAIYEVVSKEDMYDLDLSSILLFIEEHKIDIDFGEDYLEYKLEEKIF